MSKIVVFIIFAGSAKMHAAPGADPVPAAGPTARALRPAEKALKTNGFCKESRSAAQAAGAGDTRLGGRAAAALGAEK